MGSRDYYCRLDIGKEIFPAHVEGEYAERSGDHSAKPAEDSPGCPFLRNDAEGKGFVCTIYATRPRICREFRCYRMIIRTRDGIEIGRVKGRRDLSAADEPLRKVWDTKIKPISAADDNVWLKQVSAALVRAGYLTEICD
jgi:Fe-S-cluster containining protein